MVSPYLVRRHMIHNYFTVALRNLLRNKVYSAINILGLAVGISCCLLIHLYVRFEFNYDAHHSKADRIYRVLRESRFSDGRSEVLRGTSSPLSEVMREEIPEVEDTARIWRHWVGIRHEDQVVGGWFTIVDEGFFRLFDFSLEGGGDPLAPLRGPGTALVRRRAAERLFGEIDLVGKTITVSTEIWEGDYIIAGVLEDVPRNSSFMPDFITTHLPSRYNEAQWHHWIEGNWRMVRNYVLLPDDVDPDDVEEKLQPLLAKHFGPELAKTETYHLQPLLRMRLYSGVDYGLQTDRDIYQVYMLSAAGALLLLIACVNFVNLSTARASRRVREVGIRKVAGALRRQLVAQFLGEACLLSVLSGGLAVCLAYVALPGFNALMVKRLSLSHDILAPLAVLTLVVGVAAGFYPAFYLSRFQPGKALKSQHSDRGAIGVRKGLVVCQFTASIVLVIATLTVSRQMTYVSERKLGFDKSHLVNLPIFGRNGELISRGAESVKTEFLRHQNVLSASAVAGAGVLRPTPTRASTLVDGQAFSVYLAGADEDVVDVYGFELLKGRLHRSRTNEVMINESAARVLGEAGEVGKTLQWVGDPGARPIVGIVKDYHFQSLHHPISPLIIYHSGGPHIVSLKIAPTRVNETIAFLKQTWKRLVPNHPFEFEFVDARVDRLYRSEQRIGNVAHVAAGLTIFVACLGLLGLATFAAERRAKEIGIRKVLGASVASLLNLITSEFIRLVVVSNLIAWPVGYWIGRRFLASFTYRIELGIDIFLLSGILGLFLALLTVSLRTLGAAKADPVRALRMD